MRRNLLLLSDDARLAARFQAALGADCAIMTLDPRSENGDGVAARLDPDGVAVDVASHAGLATALERIAALRTRFSGVPLVAIGDEMSAQLVLAGFRAGIDDFIDREASDIEIRNTVLACLRDRAAPCGPAGGAALIHVLSGAPADEDFDFALNAASLIAAGGRRALLVDLSLPASPLRTALGVEMPFTVSAAVRDMVRLDQTFLESALARAPQTGLCLLPLSDDPADAGEPPAVQDVLLLLPMVRGLFDAVVIHWAGFSRHAVRAAGDTAQYILCCNQRFSSVRQAKALLAALRRDEAALDPVLAIHLFDADMAAPPCEIAGAVGACRSLTLRADWRALARAHNAGRPLALAGPSPYADALRAHLAAQGLAPDAPPRSAARLLRRLAGRRA